MKYRIIRVTNSGPTSFGCCYIPQYKRWFKWRNFAPSITKGKGIRFVNLNEAQQFIRGYRKSHDKIVTVYTSEEDVFGKVLRKDTYDKVKEIK